MSASLSSKAFLLQRCFAYLCLLLCVQVARTFHDIHYIPDEEFEEMLRAQHQPVLHRDKRSVTIDDGSGSFSGTIQRFTKRDLGSSF